MLRPKNCKKCGGKLQMGGMPQQQDYPDYESWQAAMDQFISGQQETAVPSSTLFRTTPIPTNNQQQSNIPYQDIGIGMRALRTALGEISGRMERGRQNQYDYRQQTALGQMNPMPYEDFQPNPYNLYMRMGGNLKTILREHQKFSNDANFDFGSGDDDKGMMNIGGYYGNVPLPKGYHIMPDGTLMRDSEMDNSYMKKGGYEIDRMLIVRKLLPELLKLGRLGSGKYRNYKKGGYQIGGSVNNLIPEDASINYDSRRYKTSPLDQDALIADRIGEIIGRGYSPFQDEGRGILNQIGRTSYGPEFAQQVGTRLFSLQQDPSYTSLSPEQKLKRLYGNPTGTTQFDDFLRRSKTIGGDPSAFYQGNPATRPIPAITFQYGGSSTYRGNYKKGGKWIQKATKSIKERGTEGVCTGEKFGSESCPPGSKRYNLAKTFRKMARNR